MAEKKHTSESLYKNFVTTTSGSTHRGAHCGGNGSAPIQGASGRGELCKLVLKSLSLQNSFSSVCSP